MLCYAVTADLDTLQLLVAASTMQNVKDRQCK